MLWFSLPLASSGRGGARSLQWERRGPKPAVGAPSSYKWKGQLRKGGPEPAVEEEGMEGGSHPWEEWGKDS